MTSIHVWRRTTLGQDRCPHCGAARMQFRTVHGSHKLRTLYWAPSGWVFARPPCITKRRGSCRPASRSACPPARRKHLALVFVHEIDPSAGPAATQDKLNAIHGTAAPTIGGVGPHGQVYRC